MKMLISACHKAQIPAAKCLCQKRENAIPADWLLLVDGLSSNECNHLPHESKYSITVQTALSTPELQYFPSLTSKITINSPSIVANGHSAPNSLANCFTIWRRPNACLGLGNALRQAVEPIESLHEETLLQPGQAENETEKSA